MAKEIKATFFNSLEDQWRNYVIKTNAELEIDCYNRKNGIKTQVGTLKYVGYTKLREFFDGDQWEYIPEAGGHLRVYNYVATTVFNYTAFMTNEPVEFDVPPREITDPIEIVRAETKETILKEILKDNEFNIQFEEAAQNGSLLGDSFILGPFYDDLNKRIYFQNVKKPENIKIVWSDDSYREMEGFIHNYYLSLEKAERIFKAQLKEKGINLIATLMPSSDETTSQQMVEIMEYWDDERRVLIINNRLLDYTEHNWGFIPLLYVRNIPHPERPWGISDVENMLDSQVEYNEKNQDVSEILKASAFPTIFGKNLKPMQIQSGLMQLIDIGDEAELMPDPRRAGAAPIEVALNNRRGDIFNISGINEVLYGGTTVRQATGRALSVLMQSVNNRIKGRQERWSVALQRFSANIFRLLELYFGAKDIIGGSYKVDIFFPGTLLRNVTDELNKYAREVQSQYTTMKNLGVPSPKDEQTIMKKEKLDKADLEMEIQQKAQQMMAEAVAQQRGTPATKPVQQEYEGQEEQPTAVAGVREQSATTPEGEITQGMQRQTGVPTITKRK